jgi:sugar phosphate isomerase/epimerase
MPEQSVSFSVFTKPWPGKSIEELGDWAHWLGFDGIELPVRPGFPVNPDNAAKELPKAVTTLAQHNVKIFSIAGTANEAMITACAESGIPTIRVMAPIGADGYLKTEEHLQKEFEALIPLLDKHHIRIGVQNHSGKYVCNAMGLKSLIGKFDPKHIGAVWDAAHNALQGEEPELALEIVWPHLCMVNLKNAVWRRKNEAKAESAEWTPYWTSGREGLASWPRVAAELKRRHYQGVVCLTAEYDDPNAVDRLISEDLHFARSLFADSAA